MVKKFYKPAAVLTLTLILAGCGLFGKDKLNIDGERLDVIRQTANLTPDYQPGELKIKLPAPYENPAWTQSGGNSLHLMGHLSADNKLKKIWESSFGEGSSKRDFLIAAPIIVNKVVFTIDAEANVSAFRLDNGKRIWKHRLKPAVRDDKSIAMKGAGIASANRKIYATTGFGGVFALDMVTGKELWRRDYETPIRIAPTVHGGKLFVQTFDNMLIALDSESGEELWKGRTELENTTLVGGAAPAYSPELDVVIAAFSNGELRAFKASTGTPLWVDLLVSKQRTNSLSNITAIKANPVIDGDKVFAVGYNSVFTAIDLRSGSRIWEKELGSSNQPWVSGDYIYVLTNDFELLCMEKKNGKIVWNTRIPNGEEDESKAGVFASGPLLAANRLIVTTSNGYIFAVSPYTGEILSYVSISDGVELAPVMAEEITVFATNEADLLAYK